MFVEVLIFMLIGIAGGTFAGLAPGIHPNTLIVLLFGTISIISGYPAYALAALVISMTITNTLVSYIPSVFLGSPEDDTSLSVLPGHRLLLDGRGLEAVYLTVVGGVGVVIMFVILLPLLIKILPILYANIKNYIPFLLIGIVSTMVIIEKGLQKLWAVIIFFLSGILGILTLNSYLIQPTFVFFPLFTGLFGISTMLLSLKSKTKLVKQAEDFGVAEKSLSISGIIKGFFSGLLVGILPAIGSAQAGTLVQIITRKDDQREFLVSLGGINTANSLFALAALYIIGNPRSGAAVAVEKLVGNFGFNEMLLLVGVTLVSTGIGAILTLFLSKKFMTLIEKVPYSTLSICVIGSLVALTAVFTGVYGLLILFVSTAIGMIAPLTNVKRSLLMGVLILPTIMFYLGAV